MTRSRTRSFFTFLAVSFVAAAAAGYGCGSSSSSSSDAVALCNNFCNKFNTLCVADAGLGVSIDCATQCTPSMVSQKTTACTNSAAIISATNTCLSKTTCTDLEACTATIPQCTATSGSGGASGGAGTSGAAGTTGAGGHAGATGSAGNGAAGTSGTAGNGAGGASGATCADLLACCNATTNATLKSACMTSYTTVMSMGDAVCGQILTSIKASYCP
jgi:hypothetical protein